MEGRLPTVTPTHENESQKTHDMMVHGHIIGVSFSPVKSPSKCPNASEIPNIVSARH